MDRLCYRSVRERTPWSEEDLDHIRALGSKYDEFTLHNAIHQYFNRLSGSSWSSSCPTVAGSSGDSSRSLAPSVDTTISTAPTLVPPTPQPSISPSKTTPGVYYCPYEQYHLDLGKPPPYFHKKGDCKVHMKLFHYLGQEWPCTRCCEKFDRERDFVKHFGRKHPGHKPGALTDIVTMLLPKQVFACGFQGCESLSQSWEQWFNHITDHMAAGMTLTQWSDSVVISNLLRQNALRQSWENLLYHKHAAYRPSFIWQPPSARVLCQKLECQDFRPGIQFLVHAAYQLSQLGSTPTDSLPGQILQTGLDTPTCDSVPEFKDNNHLDEILMRKQPGHPSSQPPVSNSPSLDYLATIGQSPTSLGLESFESMTQQSTSAALPSYTTEQTQPFPDFSGMGLDHSVADLRHTGFPSNQTPIAHDPMDVEPTHILQQLNYFDFNEFTKQYPHLSPTPGNLLRRAKSSMSLASKKSRSSPKLEPTSLPLVPPIPPTETGQSGRPRSSSQRHKLSRKLQNPHMV